jgi:phycoerythrin-associated linker protein
MVSSSTIKNPHFLGLVSIEPLELLAGRAIEKRVINLKFVIKGKIVMINSVITTAIGRSSELGVSLFEETEPVRLMVGSSSEDLETIIRAVYRQVLGNAYVMESERLTVPESQFKRGEISVREFVRQVAKSELYRTLFFDNCPRYRSIELNFKHLLGRAPHDYSETFDRSQILDRGGFEAEIDSYLDSDEYQNAFGENIVPFYRGYKTQTGAKLLGFTNMFKLLPSISTSDKAGNLGNLPRLSQSLVHNNPAGNPPVTDIQQLLDRVLKPQSQTLATPTSMDSEYQKTDRDLQRKCEEQNQLIETLQQQLAELQPFASMGTSALNKWQTNNQSSTSVRKLTNSFSSQSAIASDRSLLRQDREQEETIASLQSQIADLQRFATIGEARLNKWRNRTFN